MTIHRRENKKINVIVSIIRNTAIVVTRSFFSSLKSLFASQNIEKMPVDVVSYLYAATVAAGGIIGYVKAGNEFDLIDAKCIPFGGSSLCSETT